MKQAYNIRTVFFSPLHYSKTHGLPRPMGVLSSAQDLWYLLELEPDSTSPLLPAAFFAKLLPEYKNKIKFSKENRTFITRRQQGKCWVEEQKFPKPPANKKNMRQKDTLFQPFQACSREMNTALTYQSARRSSCCTIIIITWHLGELTWNESARIA